MHRVFLLLAEVELNPYLFVIGCLLIFGFFLFRLQRRNSQASTSSPLVRTPRPGSETLRRSETRPAELDRWEVKCTSLSAISPPDSTPNWLPCNNLC
jgi:hypothetical protein